MNAQTLQKHIDTILSANVFELKAVPIVTVCTARELGRGTDGEYQSFGHRIYIKAKPNGGSFRFILAHELAHAWQKEQGLPFNEQQADDLAFSAVGSIF